MGRNRNVAAAVLLFIAVSLASVFSQGVSSPEGSAAVRFTLVMKDRDSRIVAEIPLKDGLFDHVFVHSIHLTPVVERFAVKVDPAGAPILHLYELDYESCGVGMPSDTENGFRLVDGKFILDMSRDYAVIPLMVSTVAGHGIVADGHFYAFTDWVPRETTLFLTAKAAF